MKTQVEGIAMMLMRAVVAGIVNVALFALVINQLNVATKADEVAVNTYVLNFFVGWMLFTAWFLAKTDEEWKKVSEAVHKKEVDTFLLEAPKRIALSIRILYLIVAVLVVTSFHLFHIESAFALIEIQFGVSFFVMLATLVLWDLDDPTSGVINVPNIPQEWLEKLK